MAYVPVGTLSTAGNAVICVLFGLLCLAHTFLGLYYKRWKFALLMFAGTNASTIGYAGRVWYSKDEVAAAYIMQAVCVAIGPGLITGAVKELVVHFAVYLRMKKIHGEANWFMDKGLQRLEYYEKVNELLTTSSSVLLGVGIGVFSGDTTGGKDMTQAASVTLAAFAIQLGLVGITLILWGILIHNALGQPFISKRVRVYIFGIFMVFICILIRLSYRVAEWTKIVNDGLDNTLTIDENYLLCLDGMMILLASIILLILHPGFIFGQEELKNIDNELHEYKEQKKGNSALRKNRALQYVPVVRYFT